MAQETLIARCQCGYEARGTADEIVPLIQTHAREAHNMTATREEVLARVERA